MKFNFITFLITSLLFTTAVKAQWINDSVSMNVPMGLGITYPDDVYYSLATGQVKTVNNRNWHLAFSMNNLDSTAVWANHGNGVTVYNIHKDTTQWASVTLADTLLATMQYNSDSLWSAGALNAQYSSNIFNYGWGVYVGPPTHNIVGDSLFIIKTATGYYKIWIEKFVSMTGDWYLKIGDLITSTDYTKTITKTPNYNNNLFSYLNLNTLTDTVREPVSNTWDFVFTRYTVFDFPAAPGTPQTVVGILQKRGVLATQVAMVHVDSALTNYTTYLPSLAHKIGTIGYNWKIPPPPVWIVPDSNSYFVKDANQNLYQLQFTGFGGSATGAIYFRKRFLTVLTSVEDILHSNANLFTTYPVPAQNDVNIIIDNKINQPANLQLMNLSGQVIAKKGIDIKSGLNVYYLATNTCASGVYILTITGKNLQLTQKITINK